eukprot:CAMPEP_0113661446 /NCGR_PEP_ID=MMETSP0017_2-20120614/33430_1 /TAXON_ID=2856 /ORGANISM="Cylindrotheca closterium" /LENGTH=178 /DNA_ID=CAMNT_0000576133 /DNA_START=1540 /DNA_END=2076 /DNA_ORIENTATION=- /assembly_acc=CAM_ASM_000147
MLAATSCIYFLSTTRQEETDEQPKATGKTLSGKENKVVRIGVGVLVKDARNPDRVYCGIRKGSHGAGSLVALPGGHLEMFESWQECAIREVKEESDLDLGEVSFGHVTNDIMESENKHYVTIFMLAKCKAPNQQPKTMEPSKCEGWKAYSWSDLEKEQSTGKGPSKQSNGLPWFEFEL